MVRCHQTFATICGRTIGNGIGPGINTQVSQHYTTDVTTAMVVGGNTSSIRFAVILVLV